MNLYQRLALVAAMAVGLWGLSQALIPFEVASPFGPAGECSSPLAALSDDEPAIPAAFLGDIDSEDLQTCADVAGRKIVSALVIMALAALGGYGATRLLAFDGRPVTVDDAVEVEARDDPTPPTPIGDGAVPLGDELPPYAG